MKFVDFSRLKLLHSQILIWYLLIWSLGSKSSECPRKIPDYNQVILLDSHHYKDILRELSLEEKDNVPNSMVW